MLTISDINQLTALVGEPIGTSNWYGVSQATVDAFAEITGDTQWIHTDPARAVESRFGGTIAHGLLTLALGPKFLYSMLSFSGVESSINYGYERVRFPAPLLVGSRVRMTAVLKSVEQVAGGAAQFVFAQTFEREGSDRPVCVADFVGRVYFAPPA